ncbi:MAG: HesA/MoeB/ThiF family protein [Solirubrobacterales bacterium]
MAELRESELKRYARQLVLPGFGAEQQARLRAADVLVVGAGALGSPVAGYLAAAGVGRLGIVDDDVVELSNLQRQWLHRERDLGYNKAEAACIAVTNLNAEVLPEAYPVRLTADNAAALVAGRTVVVDCTDSLETTYAVNDACLQAGVPLVEAGVLGLTGQLVTVIPNQTACYRCLFPEPDQGAPAAPSCREAGILGPVAGIVGSAQALETIKLIAGIGDPLTDRIWHLDGHTLAVTEVRSGPRADCRCGAAGVAAGPSAGENGVAP